MFLQGAADENGNRILQWLNEDSYLAFKSSANGDCLFNSISTTLYGHENHSLHIRFLTLKYLVNNVDFIKSVFPSLYMAEEFTPTLKACSAVGGFSNVLTVFCLSQALKIRVHCVLPPMNGIFARGKFL